jgi:L-amino acid N-acyltransferase YncA
MAYTIRPAEEADATAILAVYAPFVLKTVVSFETEVPDIRAFTERIRHISAQYPYLVCLDGSTIVAYAYAHRHMERAAYGWNAELSVYVAPGHQRVGIGRTLYTCLIAILRLQNIQNLYGAVAIPNANSEMLHAALGFERLGVLHHTGYKHGQWHDVAWFEKSIGANEPSPWPFLPVTQVDADAMDAILKAGEDSLAARAPGKAQG